MNKDIKNDMVNEEKSEIESNNENEILLSNKQHLQQKKRFIHEENTYDGNKKLKMVK